MDFIGGERKRWFFGFFFNQLNLSLHPTINMLLGHGKGNKVIFVFLGNWMGETNFLWRT
jgi:hypothetical protein